MRTQRTPLAFPPLQLTGERTLPGAPGEQYWFTRHEAAYDWIVRRYAPTLAGAVVVDAGSGEGYGAARLRTCGARAVVALEYDPAAAAHAAARYPGLVSVRANLVALPLGAGSADVIVSLQVIEHLWDLAGFLRDCRRVLRPGGLLAVTTPNRVVFSPGLGRGQRPTNPFHVEEFDAAQLLELMRAAGFGAVEVLGLHHGPRLLAWEQRHGVGLAAAQLAQVTGAGPVPSGTSAFVASCTAADFILGPATDAQDLIALGVRP